MRVRLLAMVLLTTIVTPLTWLVVLALAPMPSRLEWVADLVSAAACLGWLTLVARWDWVGTYMRWLWLVGGLLVVAVRTRSVWTTSASPVRGDWDAWIAVTVPAVLGVIFLRLLYGAWAGRRVGRFHRSQAIDGVFPLAAPRCYVAHGGSDVTINYHYAHPTQRFALDLVVLGRSGRRARGWSPSRLSAYAAFGVSVVSPVTGVVLDAVDGFEDRAPFDPDRQPVAGNYVAIQPDGTDCYVLLAHLARGSVAVAKGADVTRGQLVGRVGNSGHTTEPHLHVHAAALSSGDYLSGSVAVPMTFDGRFLVRNLIVSTAPVLHPMPQ